MEHPGFDENDRCRGCGHGVAFCICFAPLVLKQVAEIDNLKQQLAAKNKEIERLKKHVPYKMGMLNIEGILKRWASVVDPDYSKILADIREQIATARYRSTSTNVAERTGEV